uniref:Uncharacterized protein n=1 Tax=Anguilla anguilla TaxID=7936 RepID=A0A0E9PPD4_ANGAN
MTNDLVNWMKLRNTCFKNRKNNFSTRWNCAPFLGMQVLHASAFRLVFHFALVVTYSGKTIKTI